MLPLWHAGMATVLNVLNVCVCVHACVRMCELGAYAVYVLKTPLFYFCVYHDTGPNILPSPSPPPPHPSQFSHLRLSFLRGDWLTVPNLGMVAPDSCCISFSEGCGESGPQSKFYQEVSPTLSTPLHMQGQQGMLDSVATTTSAGGQPSLPLFPPSLPTCHPFCASWVCG